MCHILNDLEIIPVGNQQKWDTFVHVIDGRETGVLTRNSKHRLTQEYLEWHRERWLGI
jgi:hypothetical protein